MKKRTLLTIACLMSVVLLSGCWDRREINDVAFVMATGLDKEAEQQYRVTVQIPLASQLGGIGGSGGGGGTSGGKPYFNDSVVANTVRKANEVQQREVSRQLYFAHRRVVVIGEDLAKEGIQDLMDILGRLPQNRLTSFLLVAKGTARDMLTADVPTEQFPAEVMRELAQNSMKTPRTLKHVINSLVTDGLDTAIPYLELDMTKPGEKGKPHSLIRVSGIAVFRHNRLAGVLRGEEGNAMLLAMNEAKRPSFTIQSPDGSGHITALLQQNTSNLETTVEGDLIRVKINVQAKGYVVENQSSYDLASDNNLSKLGFLVADRIRTSILDSMKLLQNEYHSDPIGIGLKIYRSEPERWKQLRQNWEEEYAKVQVEVNPLVHLEHTGIYTAPMARKKGEVHS
ncbi:MAG: Ger(x)C family spore germination protein [Tumebacillaceae bacterium]